MEGESGVVFQEAEVDLMISGIPGNQPPTSTSQLFNDKISYFGPVLLDF
jgi:hypothetical protein